MSLRYNSVIVENGRRGLYFDRYNSDVIDTRLFFGPEYARAFIEQGQVTRDWLDQGWCAGGCVLDFDAKCLLWFGGEQTADGIKANWAQSILMRHTWSNWQVDWATNGISDLMRCVDVQEPRNDIARPSPKPLRHAEITPEFDDYVSIFFTMVATVSKGGHTKSALLLGAPIDFAHPDVSFKTLSDLIDQFPTNTVLNAQDNLLYPTAMWDGFGFCGAHVDADSRTIDLWSVRSSPTELQSISTQWPGWNIENHGPDFAWHKPLFPTLRWPDTRASLQSRLATLRLGPLEPNQDRLLSKIEAQILRQSHVSPQIRQTADRE